MNLFVLSGHGSESFAAFLNGVRLQKTTRPKFSHKNSEFGRQIFFEA